MGLKMAIKGRKYHTMYSKDTKVSDCVTLLSDIFPIEVSFHQLRPKIHTFFDDRA